MFGPYYALLATLNEKDTKIHGYPISILKNLSETKWIDQKLQV